MKKWEDLRPRTKYYYVPFAKQGVRPVLESIAPGQGEELWNYLKSSSITGLGNSDNDCDEDEEISSNTFSDVITEDIFWLASPVLVMKLGSESLAMTSAKLNMAKTFAIERQQQWSNMQRHFVAETKTDILTACDLKKALESNGGVIGMPSERCRNAAEIQPN